MNLNTICSNIKEKTPSSTTTKTITTNPSFLTVNKFLPAISVVETNNSFLNNTNNTNYNASSAITITAVAPTTTTNTNTFNSSDPLSTTLTTFTNEILFDHKQKSLPSPP